MLGDEPGRKQNFGILGRAGQLHRPYPGLDSGGPGLAIDLDLAHALGLDHDRVPDRTDGSSTVPSRLAEDPEVMRGGIPEHGG
jgi:hypothetical protein